MERNFRKEFEPKYPDPKDWVEELLDELDRVRKERDELKECQCNNSLCLNAEESRLFIEELNREKTPEEKERRRKLFKGAKEIYEKAKKGELSFDLSERKKRD